MSLVPPNYSGFMWSLRRDDRDCLLALGALDIAPDLPQELVDSSGKHRASTPNYVMASIKLRATQDPLWDQNEPFMPSVSIIINLNPSLLP